MPARTARQKKWPKRFLAALERCGCVTTACRVVQKGRRTAYDLRDKDPEFAAAWDEIVDRELDQLEASAMKRAQRGGLKRRFSDTLTIFMLRQRRPDKWARAEKLKLDHGGDVTFQIVTGVPDSD
jgi:hypothetical protein